MRSLLAGKPSRYLEIAAKLARGTFNVDQEEIRGECDNKSVGWIVPQSGKRKGGPPSRPAMNPNPPFRPIVPLDVTVRLTNPVMRAVIVNWLPTCTTVAVRVPRISEIPSPRRLTSPLYVPATCGYGLGAVGLSLHATATTAPRAKARSRLGSTPGLYHRGIRLCAKAVIVAGAASRHTVYAIHRDKSRADLRGVPHLDRPGAVRWHSQFATGSVFGRRP